MTVYYNEHDPYAAAWLRNLIAAGHIAPGDVDERSIEDVGPDDLRGYVQCHFFAGIGVWSHALRSAGWPDSLPVWTGSCPCQPFSAAGKGAGFADERHLWPAFHHLIRECRPARILGEQVASKDGYGWLDLVQADLEDVGYACGAIVSPAAGYGAPHERHRQYWLAYTDDEGSQGCDGEHADASRWAEATRHPRPRGSAGGLADADRAGLGVEPQRHRQSLARREACEPRLDDAGRGDLRRPGPTNGFWRDADWLGCRDAKWRPVKPGTFVLADGYPGRVGKLRAAGNAIVAPQAQAFIEAAQDILDLRLSEEDIFS